MAKPMALETSNIRIPALRLESMTRGGLERLQLLLWGNKLVLDGKEPANLPSLSPLPNRLPVRLMLFLYKRFSMFNRLIDPLRGTDRVTDLSQPYIVLPMKCFSTSPPYSWRRKRHKPSS